MTALLIILALSAVIVAYAYLTAAPESVVEDTGEYGDE